MKIWKGMNSELLEHLKSFLVEKGGEALKKARDIVLDERLECEEIQKALRYFMVEYWNDCTTPSLLFLACEAVGGDSERLLDFASAMILVNGAIDIHDDIIDRSKRKDGRPTVYGKFGVETALLVGNALLMKGYTMLAEDLYRKFGGEKAAKVLDVLKKGFFELGEAEALELKFKGRFDVKPREYLKVMHKKAANVDALMRAGALLGGATNEEIGLLGKYGRIVGLLSILHDDVVDMMLPEEMKHRIKYESLPLPIIYGLNTQKTRQTLLKLLQEKLVKATLDKICEVTEKAGGIRKTRMYMGKQAIDGKRVSSKFPKIQDKLNLILECLTKE